MLYEIAGLAGVLCYLGGYAALQIGLIRGRGYIYPATNLAAALFILISLMGAFNFWVALTQMCFAVISVYGIGRMFLLNRRLSFSDEDSALVQTLLPDAPRLMARTFLNAGMWMDVTTKTPLTREGRMVEHMVFLHRGAAAVMSGGARLATLSAGHMVGEIGAAHDKPASADVIVTEPSRVFMVPAHALQALLGQDVEFRVHFERAMGRDNHGKLLATNAALQSQGGIQEPLRAGETDPAA